MHRHKMFYNVPVQFLSFRSTARKTLMPQAKGTLHFNITTGDIVSLVAIRSFKFEKALMEEQLQ